MGCFYRTDDSTGFWLYICVINIPLASLVCNSGTGTKATAQSDESAYQAGILNNGTETCVKTTLLRAYCPASGPVILLPTCHKMQTSLGSQRKMLMCRNPILVFNFEQRRAQRVGGSSLESSTDSSKTTKRVGIPQKPYRNSAEEWRDAGAQREAAGLRPSIRLQCRRSQYRAGILTNLPAKKRPGAITLHHL
jgi:hypothetical protein